MKRLMIFVEGQTEEEFVKNIITPYLNEKHGITSVTPIKIATSAKAKGGFVNYMHLKNDVSKRIREKNLIVSMFVDYFRIPHNLPNYVNCVKKGNVDDRITCLEEKINEDINSENFIPYIQKHEFEALLFSSNNGFLELYEENISSETEKIVNAFPNPEEINSHASTAPSKRIISIIKNYDKVAEGNLIALEIGIENILQKCPRFKNWIDLLILKVSAS